MPITESQLEQIYKKVLDGEPDLDSFSRKEIEASKQDLDSTMQTKPELVKAMIRVGLLRSTDTILKALMAEARECLPVMQAIVNIIAKTLEFKTTHDGEVSVEFFGELIKTEVDKTWVTMQGAFAEHLKEEKREN